MPQYGGGGYEVRTRRANLSQRMQVAKGLGTRMEALAKRVLARLPLGDACSGITRTSDLRPSPDRSRGRTLTGSREKPPGRCGALGGRARQLDRSKPAAEHRAEIVESGMR